MVLVCVIVASSGVKLTIKSHISILILWENAYFSAIL